MMLSYRFVSARSFAGFLHQLRTGPAVSTGQAERFFAGPGVDSGGRVRGGGEWRTGRYRTQGERHVPDHHRPPVTAPRYATTRSAMSLRRTMVVVGLVAAAVHA